MPSVTVEEAQARLPDLIAHLQPGESLVITRNAQPVARLSAEATPKRHPRKAGSAKGILVVVKDDNEHLADFAEYME